MLLTILSLVIVLGVLIFVHELGHFVVAKAVGIQVLRFSLGFGRPVLQWTRGETEYWVSWIPLGGYVKMAGLEEEGMVGELEGGKASVAIDPTRAFDSKPLGSRLAVILAGVTMNLLLAFAIYTGLAGIAGEPRPALTPVDSVDAAKLPPGAEALAGLKRGERITHINDDSLTSWEELAEKVADSPGELRLRIAGRSEPLVLRLPADTGVRRNVLRSLTPMIPPRIGPVNLGQPAHRAGLKAGDVVLRVDRDTVIAWSDMVRRIRENPGKPLVLTVQRNDQVLQIPVTPEVVDSGGQRYGMMGAYANPPIVRERVPLGRAFVIGVRQTVGQVGTVVVSVKRLVTGQASAKELGGPIAIAQMSGQAARLGLDWFLNFLAFFSVSLAVLNLLPIPVLDGGHAMFLLIEAVRRKPLSPQLRLRLTQIGMLIVFAIMILAISNDVIRNVR